MPTYDYKCQKCESEDSVIQSISSYVRAPIRPVCCEQEMERMLSINPAFSGVANALAGDRHYDGMTATDGTPINSRTKHREYMKSKGLAMTGDFTETWKQAAKEREAIRTAQALPERKRDVREVVERAIQN